MTKKIPEERRQVLARMAAGWTPMRLQLDWKYYERRGLIRVDYGPEGTPLEDRMCCYLTAAGRTIAQEK